MERILVVGLKEVDAGKTTLTLALLDYLRGKGLDVCGFKPRAGNNLWYDFDVLEEALSRGTLYGKDAKLLHQASHTSLPVEVVNPVHRIWGEPTLQRSLSLLPPFILDRITLCGEKTETILVENISAASDSRLEELWKGLRSRASKVYRVRDGEGQDSLMEYYNLASDLAYKRVGEAHEVVVIESYGNIALPWPGLRKLDLVLAVEPSRLLAYDPDKYLTAVQLSRKLQGEISTGEVVRLIKPQREMWIPPLKRGEVEKKLREDVLPFFGIPD
ncbi:hypothetical protein [Candidatus Hecatella orcuttiae]|uniref:hypothetical protein n=1 Tax=Candidatus Hecatella orcuttiae TaxID=1935119 RepID=UPI0028680068|nr:hypothetical protein [Candidatus Hecatella orcuttiae]